MVKNPCLNRHSAWLKIHADTDPNVSARLVGVVAKEAVVVAVDGVEEVVCFDADAHGQTLTNLGLNSNTEQCVAIGRGYEVSIILDT